VDQLNLEDTYGFEYEGGIGKEDAAMLGNPKVEFERKGHQGQDKD
jgi:hypothetical protein